MTPALENRGPMGGDLDAINVSGAVACDDGGDPPLGGSRSWERGGGGFVHGKKRKTHENKAVSLCTATKLQYYDIRNNW